MAKKSPLTWSNQTRKLSDLIPWPDNPRFIADEQAQRLDDSFRKFGQVDPLAISPENELYNGHQRLKVLVDSHGPDYEIDVRVSSRPLTEAERKQLTVYLHRGATGEWDFEKLATWDLGDLLEWGFEADDLNFETPAPAGTGDAEPQIDRAAELQEKWQTERGQLWAIGEHRLLCGDSTVRADVERVMGGEKADGVVTDPPYGIDFDTDYTRFTIQSGKNNKYQPIVGDDKPFDPTPLLDFDSVVLWGANYYADKLPHGTWLIWDKRFANGEAWLSDAEIAWMKGGTGVYIFSLTSQGFVRPEPVRHPTQKAVALMQWCIEKSKAGNVIYDPFCGSGTTLVACQNLSRRGRAIEISPAYCAVILQRMADAFPGIDIHQLP